MKLLLRKFLVLLIASFCYVSIYAQGDTNPDSAKTTPGSGFRMPMASKPRPYAEVITAKAKTDKGLFKVHKVDEKYYFEIPDSLFKKEILVVNRVSKAPSGVGSDSPFQDAGDQISQKVVWFEKGPKNKVFIRTIYFTDQSKDSTSSMFTAVKNSNVYPISTSFDIKAFTKDSSGVVIEITDFINGDNDVLYLSSSAKSAGKLSAVQPDKSYLVSIQSFPINIEITAVKTYTKSASPLSPGSGGGNITLELNSSMVLLPKVPMQARYGDSRVGYFDVGYTDYDLNPQGVKSVTMVKRWRLEPKDADREKYMKGELVEPKKPIVFYIDPATPEKWIPYLIQGINDWQSTFEKAGFKNAIYAKRAPTKKEDPEWNLDDALHSAIVYKASTTANASGPSIADPRSGEIMESHVNWYHNVMSLLRNWYMIQAGPNDPRARKMVFDDALMGQLIRFVSSHEIGHTLGLRHNFGSSSTVPVENLRNKAWVEKNGHTPSIMDYARFNYVAQPEDSIGEKGIFPRINDYDDWAIEWGYRRFLQYKTPDEEKSYLNKWVIEKLKNKRLWFGDGEFYREDPRCLTEQVGDDAVKGSMYGIKNLQRIVPKLMEWTKQPNEDYQGLSTMYKEVVNQFERYNNHVIARVGGILRTPKTVEESGPVYMSESKSQQKEAVLHINKNVFSTPKWLLNNEIFDKAGINGLKIVGTLQENALGGILKRSKLDNLVEAQANTANKDVYSIIELLSDLKKGVWNELYSHEPIDIYRRQLQQTYIKQVNKLLNPGETKLPTDIAGLLASMLTMAEPDLVDVTSSLRANLTELKSDINAAATASTDQMTKIHLKDMSRRIEDALNPKK
ncbi:MAG: zinc-dependent metalloprotease [Prolixibacteraceae bacterium]